MTISDTTRSIRASGNGITTAFSFPFPVFDSSNIKVYKIDTSTDPETQGSALTEGVDYTVSLNTVSEGGTVTYTVAPTSDEDSFIIRDIPYTQGADFVTNESFDEEAVEDTLDKVTMLTIQNEEELERCIKVSEYYDGSADFTLPEPDGSKIIGWASDGLSLENYANTISNHNSLAGLQLASTGITYGHIDDQAQSIYGVKTFNSFPVTPSSLPTSNYQTSNKRFVDIKSMISVKEYGAVGDGVTDDYTAFSNAISASAGRGLLIPYGTYRIGTNLTVSNTQLFFENGGIIKPDSGKSITLNCVVSAGIYKIFDISAGGTFTGDVLTESIYPQWFGAIATLPNDCTSAIQASLNLATAVAGKGKTVRFPAGYYTLSSTLTAPYSSQGLQLIGEGKTRTKLYRIADYGNTLRIGDSAHSSVENVTIEGLWFWHNSGYESGQPPSALINPVSVGTVHILAYGLIRCKIRHCQFWNMTKSLWCYGGSTNDISFNTFKGLWDHIEVTLQEMTENILLQQHPLGGICTDYRIRDNSFVGYLSPSRSVTYGTWTGSIQENIGALTGIRIKSAEVIQISGGNIGSMNDAGITVEPQNGKTCVSVFINGIFFDGNRLQAVAIENTAGSQTLYNCIIENNVMIGQENSDNAIWVGLNTDPTPSCTGLIISNNHILNYVKGAVIIRNAKGVQIQGNVIRDWNTKGGYMADKFNATGIYIDTACDKVNIDGNTLGGGNAFEAYDGGPNNYCDYGIVYSLTATNFTQQDNQNYGANTLVSTVT